MKVENQKQSFSLLFLFATSFSSLASSRGSYSSTHPGFFPPLEYPNMPILSKPAPSMRAVYLLQGQGDRMWSSAAADLTQQLVRERPAFFCSALPKEHVCHPPPFSDIWCQLCSMWTSVGQCGTTWSTKERWSWAWTSLHNCWGDCEDLTS